MAHYGLLRNYRFNETAEDIRGANLYGRDDDKLGKIDDVIFDHATGNIRYVVVDTGWLRTKKFLVPAERLRTSTKHKDDFASDLTKEQVESFPPYNESDLESEEKWGDYESRYRAKWETGPVMHRTETDRNITPTTYQAEGNQSSIQASGDYSRQVPVSRGADEQSVEAAESLTERVIPAGRDTVVIDNTAVGIGGRWDTFQARLRERRKEAVTGCRTCAIGPIGTKGSESADTLKKAI
jgi:stress response protein YsnF